MQHLSRCCLIIGVNTGGIQRTHLTPPPPPPHYTCKSFQPIGRRARCSQKLAPSKQHFLFEDSVAISHLQMTSLFIMWTLSTFAHVRARSRMLCTSQDHVKPPVSSQSALFLLLLFSVDLFSSPLSLLVDFQLGSGPAQNIPPCSGLTPLFTDSADPLTDMVSGSPKMSRGRWLELPTTSAEVKGQLQLRYQQCASVRASLGGQRQWL